MKKKSAKIPYEAYELPESSKLGGQFIDWNEVMKEMDIKSIRIVKRKRRNK